MARIIVLVGMMGSGKTTIGRLLADRLRCRFVDTDDLVVADAGRSVRDIFATDGEAVFRSYEQRALSSALESTVDVVVAAAGGSVLSDVNRAALAQRADVVVWLDATVATLGERTGGGSHRPLLDDDPIAGLTKLDSQRRAVYEQVADVRIDTTGRSVTQVVEAVLAATVEEHAS